MKDYFLLTKKKLLTDLNIVTCLQTIEVFGFGKNFISLINLLYSGFTVLMKVGEGLSRTVPLQNGIRQGCPLSGMLYALALEPLLSQLRQGLTELAFEKDKTNTVSLSAYAEYITLFITSQNDIQILERKLALYEQGSSAKVNWLKCDDHIV